MAKKRDDTFDPLTINPDDPMKMPHRRLPDGTPNIEYYREAYAQVTRDAMRCLREDIKPATDPQSLAKLLLAEAKLCGISESDVVDRRSREDIMRDGFNRLTETPEGLFEVSDEMLEHLEEEGKRCLERCKAFIEDENGGSDEPRVLEAMRKVRERQELGKAMLNRIRRVVRLRDAARNPVPKYLPKLEYETDRGAWEASHILRYMLYVGRANNVMLKGGSTATSKLFRFGEMHADMAVCLWKAEHGIKFDLDGIKWGARKVGGAIINAPPGHGKSEMAMHHASLWISRRPMTQGVYLHAGEDQAKKAVAYIKSTFDPSSDRGRRNMALFPKVKLAKRGNDAKQMQIETAVKTKSPTLVAAGVTSDRQGSNTDYQIRDDIVPQSDAHEEATRKRRKEMLAGTWDRRQRGNNTFTLNIGTLWHTDDALAVMVKQAKAGKGPYDLCVIKCGGPKTSPEFYAAWPEVYPPSWLRDEFVKMANANLWSAAFMGNPKANETRLIQAVRLYDKTCDQHRLFLRTCEMHLSADPAATRDPKNDKMGLIYAGIGEVESVDLETKAVDGVVKLRILDAKELHNTPGDLVETIRGYATTHRVDHLHIETKTGFAAVADWVDSEFDIECIRHEPKNNNKGQRLGQCAGLICRKVSEVGGFEAVVEFPGVPKTDKEGKPIIKDGYTVLIPDPDYEWLIEQFTEFGNNASDHALDATTQLINWASRNDKLPASGGLVTRKIVEQQSMEGCDARIRDAFRKAAAPKPMGTVEDKLVDFFAPDRAYGKELSWN